VSLLSTSARQGEQLVEDLLAFSRLGRHPLAKRLVKVAAVVRDVMRGLGAHEPTRWLQIHLAADLPDVNADPTLLRQVFENLLSNAFKFTQGRDPATITVGSEVRNDESVFFVRDNGAGFDMRYASRLFGVFQRLHTQEQFAGTGVGLSLVQRIINRHGGRIWAEAEVNKGATFFFTLGA